MPSEFSTTKKVLNRFSLVEPPGPPRIAVVAQSPGEQESYFGAPLVGPSGELLRDSLGQVGIPWNQLFLGNVCQFQPPANHFDAFDWNGPKVQAGIEQLHEDLEKFRPTIILCLGNEALHLFKNGNAAPPRRGKEIDWPDKIGNWRGSLFSSPWLGPNSNDPGQGVKCLAAFHPAAVLREYALQGYYRTGLSGVGDFERLRLESESAELKLPSREITTFKDVQEVLEWSKIVREERLPIAADLEGYPGNVKAIGFARTASTARVIPLAHIDGASVWTEEEEILIWEAVKAVMEDPEVPKIFQHGQYDLFALAWTYGIAIHNWSDDTEEGGWELCAELRKGLATQASLYTKQPFYKPDKEEGEMVFESDEQFWTYNGTDAAVTYEVWQRQQELMLEPQRRHYRFNMNLKPVILYMSLRGMKVDGERVKEESEKALRETMELQAWIDEETVALGARQDDLRCLLHLHELSNDERETTFAELALRCLGCKKPRVKVEVMEERWQPMKWNGKKWVKNGKIKNHEEIGADLIVATEQLPTDVERCLVPKLCAVSRLQPFRPATLIDCDPYILESKQAEWKKVKAIWKEKLAKSSVLLGELSTLLGLAINVSSTGEKGDAQWFLFDLCGLPEIYKDERTGRLSIENTSALKARKKILDENEALLAWSPDEEDPTTKLQINPFSRPKGKRLSTDQNALDLVYSKTQDVRVLWVLQQRRLKKVVTDLAKEIDNDGRIRCSFSLVKETGRMAASESPTGTGTNMQAWNKDLRRACVADEGCLMGQCDLEGADSWTVAAECAALGDMTMLEDLRTGLKPAKVLCLLYLLSDQANGWDRTMIKAKLKELEQPKWLYPGAKSCVHGSSYGMGIPTMIQTVLRYSMADLPLELGETLPTVMETAQAKKLQESFFSRYPGVKLWHESEKRSLLNKGFIVTSAGHLRRFYGRKAEWKKGQKVANHETLKEALASKPQFYTTWANKMAVWRMWNDEENRTAEGDLKVEPLMVVHDSVVSQWKREDDAFARLKHHEWFQNEVEIAGQKIVIPADGAVGLDWSMKEVEKL